MTVWIILLIDIRLFAEVSRWTWKGLRCHHQHDLEQFFLQTRQYDKEKQIYNDYFSLKSNDSKVGSHRTDGYETQFP